MSERTPMGYEYTLYSRVTGAYETGYAPSLPTEKELASMGNVILAKAHPVYEGERVEEFFMADTSGTRVIGPAGHTLPVSRLPVSELLMG